MGGESPVVELYDSNGNPLSVQNGIAIPANTPALMVAGSDGTNSRYLSIDGYGHLIVVGDGIAGIPHGGVITIQGDPSGTPVPVSGTVTANIGTTNGLALDATLAKLTISQGTALGTNTQALVGGSVTTASPTYTNGNINPLSLTTAGALRVDGSAVTQPVSGTITANQGTNPWVTNVTQFGSSNVVTGTGTSGAGIPRVTVSNDSNILATQSGTWTVAQGAPNTLANGWPVKVTDGTNTMPTGDTVTRALFEKITDGTNTATVKAASTAAVATDTALVVAVSPNNPVFTTAASDITPATQNITVQDTASTTTSGANSQTIITGTPTAGSAATFAVSSLETAQVQVSGTWTGTLQVEVSPDGGTTWYIRRLHQTGTDTISSSFTANFSGGANIGAYTNIRVRAIAAMTGTAVVKVTESVNNNSIYVGNAIRTTDNAGNYMPAMDVASRKGFMAVTDGTNTAAVKASSIAPTGTDPALVVSLSPNNSLFSFGGDSRLRVGQETLLFFDNIDGTTIDLNKWTQSQSGMTQSQTGGNLTLNSGSSTGSGNYSILTSTKQMLILDEFPLYVQFRARLISQTNAVIELGFGNAATTATPTDGVFFRIDATGNLKGVINFNGTETTTATLGTLTASTFYNFEVTIYEDHASYEVQSSDGATNIDVDLAIPLANGSPISVGHLPVYARVYNSSATSSAAQIVMASVNVQQMDLNMNKPWAEQVSGAGRSAIIDPSTLAQSANYTNNTTASIATLSNTAAGYTTLGGLYRFNAPAGAETDYALFGYQVPDGAQLYIWSVTITAFITGAQSTTQPTLLQWAVAANSSAVSLATGAPNPPIFLPIGMQQAPKTASIGDPFNPGTIAFIPKTPLVINGGRFFHIVLRVPVGNATASQVIRGSITVEGYFE